MKINHMNITSFLKKNNQNTLNNLKNNLDKLDLSKQNFKTTVSNIDEKNIQETVKNIKNNLSKLQYHFNTKHILQILSQDNYNNANLTYLHKTIVQKVLSQSNQQAVISKQTDLTNLRLPK